MHVSSKDVVTDKDIAKELGVELGAHILTNTIEADGPLELCSPEAKFEADVIAVRRTASGGIFVQTAVHIKEPVKVAPKLPGTADDQALEYLASKKYNETTAKSMLEKYGSAKILEFKRKDEAAAQEAQDAELAEALGLGKKDEPKAAEPVKPPTLQ